MADRPDAPPPPPPSRLPYVTPAIERLGPWRLITLQGSLGIFPGPMGDANGFLDAAHEIAAWDLMHDILGRP